MSVSRRRRKRKEGDKGEVKEARIAGRIAAEAVAAAIGTLRFDDGNVNDNATNQ